MTERDFTPHEITFPIEDIQQYTCMNCNETEWFFICNRQVMIPMDILPVVLAYNREFFEERGMIQRIEQVIRYVEDLKHGGNGTNTIETPSEETDI